MSEIESCNLESIGKGRKKVAGASKSARGKKITSKGKKIVANKGLR